MKRLLYILLIISVLASLIACSNYETNDISNLMVMQEVPETPPPIDIEDETNDYIPDVRVMPEIPGPPPPIDIEVVSDYFTKLHAIWDEDNGALWGIPLHTPLIIADSITRAAVANMPDPKGFFQKHGDVYIGTLPHNVLIGATSVEFNGLEWGMMPWEMVANEDEVVVLSILAHEGFHAIKNRIISGEYQGTQNLNHMDELNARISVMLELTALTTALRASCDERMVAIHDALSIRSDRRARHSSIATIEENSFEIHEGLTTFTDLVLVRKEMDEILNFLEENIHIHSETNNLRHFGYFSGSMYALLLEGFGADWKNDISYHTDLADLLRHHIGVTELTPFELLNLEPYGDTEIKRIQTNWYNNFIRIVAEGDDALNNQPTVRLIGNYHVNFNHTYIEWFFLPEFNMVYYGNFTTIGANWWLNVRNGYIMLLSNGIKVGSAVDIDIDENGTFASSPTWDLVITDENYFIDYIDNRGRVIIAER